MKLPVLTIVSATLRDLLRFVAQHPFAVSIASACTLPLTYQLGLMEWADGRQASPRPVAAPLALSMLCSIIWLPLYVVAIRQTAFKETVRVAIGGMPSAATLRYAVYMLALLSVSQVALSGGRAPGLVVAQAVVGFALTWFCLRTTLTFTALALGRLDLSLVQSIRRTSGQTFRLLAILALTLATVLAPAFIAAGVLTGVLDEADTDSRSLALAAIGVWNELAALAVVMAGAHIYRLIETSPDQNGRY